MCLEDNTKPNVTLQISTRHHTKGRACSEISLPKIAVKPQIKTQKWRYK